MLLHVEFKVDDISIPDNIFLALRLQFAGFFRGRGAAQRIEGSEGNDFGFDEPALKVGVDPSRCLGRPGAFLDSPGPGFLLVVGEEADQVEQPVAFLDHQVQAGLFDAGKGHIIELFFRGEFVQVGFKPGADLDPCRVPVLGNGPDGLQVRMVFVEVLFPDIGRVDDRLGGQEAHFLVESKIMAVLGSRKGGQRVSPGKVNLDLPCHFQGGGKALVPLGLAGQLVNFLLYLLQVRQDQFQFNNFDIFSWIGNRADMDHVGVFEAAHDMKQGVCIADMAQELVAQPFSLAGAFHQAGDIHEFDGRLNDPVHFGDLRDPVQPGIRDRDHSLVGLDRAEGIIGNFRLLSACKDIEQGAFPHVGKPDDANLKRHDHLDFCGESVISIIPDTGSQSTPDRISVVISALAEGESSVSIVSMVLLIRFKVDSKFIPGEKLMSIAIISDTDTSLPQNILDEYMIDQVPITIHFGDEVLAACDEITDQGMVDRVEQEGVVPTTAAPSPGAFSEAYQRAFDGGAQEIICLTVSAGVSATYQSALSAKEMHPGKKITVVDTESISLGQGFMVLEAARLAREGKSKKEILDAVVDIRERTHLYAALDTLKYMALSGRVSHLTAEMANVLSIKPILTILDGKLDLLEKSRTRKKAWTRVVELSVESLGGGEIEQMYVLHVAAEGLAEEFIKLLRSTLPCPEVIPVTGLTPGLSVHTGANLVGVAFTTKP